MRRTKPSLLAAFCWFLLVPACTSASDSSPATTTTGTEPTPTSSISTVQPTPTSEPPPDQQLVYATGAERFVDDGLVEIRGARVGLIANQTSVTSAGHLADVLAASPDVELAALFAPEHGLRGEALAGETVADSVDAQTGVEVFSLYGPTRKPTPDMLAGLDVLIYDVQDVGARFYTFISTMGLSMQAAAEAGVTFMVLDRPNPQGGNSVAGFTRTPELESFISQYPIPSTYGLTAGELASAIRGEGWISGVEDLDLRVSELQGWTRKTLWADLPARWIAPSPALPTLESAQAYPGIVLFEATNLDYGRGSDSPFLVIKGEGIDGAAVAEDMNSRGLPGVMFDAEPTGVRYRVTDPRQLEPVSVGVHLMQAFMKHSPTPIIDRPEIFDLLAGSSELRTMLQDGLPASEIVASWAADVAEFKALRASYLRY